MDGDRDVRCAQHGLGVPDVGVDAAESMMLAVAQGSLVEVSDIATELRRLGVVA
jgi:hypothetical protein